MRIQIKVTQKHIDRGEAKSLCHCPLAQAIAAAGFDYVQVSGFDASIGGCTFPLTKRMEKFVSDFDTGVAVSPCKFTWNIPNEYAQFEDINAAGRK